MERVRPKAALARMPREKSTAPNGRINRTVVEYAIEALRHGIFEGHFAPGQRLIEGELTETLRVSRGPLREAPPITRTTTASTT